MRNALREGAGGAQGDGLRILTETVSSPTLAAQIARSSWRRCPRRAGTSGSRPAATPSGRARGSPSDSRRDAVRRLEGRRRSSRSTPTSFASGPGACAPRATSRAAARGRATGARRTRFYAVEIHADRVGDAAPTTASRSSASERRALAALARSAAVTGGAVGRRLPVARRRWRPTYAAAGARALVVAGEHAPAGPRARHAINGALGTIGTTVLLTDPVQAEPVDQVASIRDLVADLDAGRVDTLLILGGNPVFTRPRDLRFADAIAEGHVPRAPLALRGRDERVLHVAPERGAFPRGLERRARLRRDGLDRRSRSSSRSTAASPPTRCSRPS